MRSSSTLRKLALGSLLLMLNSVSTPAAPLKVQTATLRVEGRQVAAWYPAEVDRPLPLVLFSHGFGGVNLQSSSLLASLAGAGYLVLAPNHKDAASWAGGEGKSRPQASFGRPESWTSATYKDRRDDLLAVYRAIPNEPRLARLYADGPVILMGHSLGGYTALGMAGARDGWSSELRPAGVVALSPYLNPYLQGGELSRVEVPVMYQGGTTDQWITPYVSQAGGAYDQTSGDKVFVNFSQAGHLAWTELDKRHHPAMARYAIAFCDRYAKGVLSPALQQKLAGVSELRSRL